MSSEEKRLNLEKTMSAVRKWAHKQLFRFRLALSDWYTKIYCAICPLKKKVVFDHFGGRGYGDNPKYIAEEIHRQGLDWELVWLANDIHTKVPPYIRVVEYGSNQAMREISSAKFYVDNIRNSVRPPKKKGQIYVQTWHGGLGFKYAEGAIEQQLNESYVAKAKEDGRGCDAIISQCRMVSEEDYIPNFWLGNQTEILNTGLPRNDALFDKDHTQRSVSDARNTLKLSETTKVVLYMPTFRDDCSTDGYLQDYTQIIEAFEEKFRCSFVLIVRMHPNVEKHIKNIRHSEKVVNGNIFADPQMLYLLADYLITDYSSAAFDFALLKKPVFLCALDLERYNKDRGLKPVFFQVPFCHAYTIDELIHRIQSFNYSDYDKAMAIFEKEWCPYDDGSASRQVVEWMKRKVQ